MRPVHVGLVSGLALWWFFACSAEPASDGGSSRATGDGGYSAGEATGGVPATGGVAVTGGVPATGGVAATGGVPATGAAGGLSGVSGSAATGGEGALILDAGDDASRGGTHVVDAGELPDVVFEYDAGAWGEPDACASTTVTAPPIYLDLVIVVDRSSSMNEPGWESYEYAAADCNVDEEPIKASKWCRAINALMDFFEDPSSVGMGVGFRTYSGSPEEVPADCGTYASLDVPETVNPGDPSLGIIQGGADDPLLVALEAEMNYQWAEGMTPTEQALSTIIHFTAARQGENDANGADNRRVIGILVTDGKPTQCEREISLLNQLVVDHYGATGIPTYFIGMAGAEYPGLETMAVGAGSEAHYDYCNDAVPTPCYHYDVGEGDGRVLVDALEAIRTSVIGCQFAMPTAEQGLVNLDSIEVRFTPNETADPELLARILGGEAACGSNEGYYTDDDDDPTTILLCPATCTRAAADPTSSVSIELLCEGS